MQYEQSFAITLGKMRLINIAQQEDKDIDTLCQLYLKAITDEMGIQNK